MFCRNEISIISTQRTTNFQYFKPIEFLSSSYDNKLYYQDNDLLDDNYVKSSSYEDRSYLKDKLESNIYDLNPYFIDDNEELHEYMKGIVQRC